MALIICSFLTQAILQRHRVTSKLVVAKQIPVSGLRIKEQECLATEVAVQASLRHRYIVELYGFYETQDHVWLIMEFAAGGALSDYIAQLARDGKEMEMETAAAWLSQMATALEYVHSMSVLHRDMSSKNVFLSFLGDIRLGDFGNSTSQARSIGGKSAKAETQCGTPVFMSPELINGEAYGKPSDVWALGVILFEMLTLLVPFDAPSLGGLVSDIIHGKMDEKALSIMARREAPPQLKMLASPEGLLNHSPEHRTTLPEVLRLFPLTEEEETLQSQPLTPEGRSLSATANWTITA